MNNYYVYALAYPDGRVFYVGKGTRDRIASHEREARDGGTSEKCNIIRGIWEQGRQVLKKKLYVNLSEDDAFAIEAVLIALFDCANLANGQSGHKKAIPFKAKRWQIAKPRKIIGYRHHTYMKDGLYNRDAVPIYEDEIV